MVSEPPIEEWYPYFGTNPQRPRLGSRLTWLLTLRRPDPETPCELRSTFMVGVDAFKDLQRGQQDRLPRPPNVPLLRALWSLLDGIWGLLKGSRGVLVHVHN